jgi:hypothetical protein
MEQKHGKDVAASVRAKLYNLSKSQGLEFDSAYKGLFKSVRSFGKT